MPRTQIIFTTREHDITINNNDIVYVYKIITSDFLATFLALLFKKYCKLLYYIFQRYSDIFQFKF